MSTSQKTFQAKEYADRKDLEKIIKAEVGIDMPSNREAGHKIEGTRQELEKLYLDDTKHIWGVRVVITDSPTKGRVKKKLAKLK